MSLSKKADHDLSDYLHRRLKYFEECYAEIENKLSDAKMDLCRDIDDGQYTKNDPAIGRIIFKLEYVVGNTFRYTMLVGICSFLEEAIKAITERRVLGYEAKLKAQKKGNWLRKHIHVLCESVGLNVVTIQTDLETFYNLITLRNCIVHAWGNVSEARDPNAVQAAALRMQGTGISKDGYLLLDDQVVPEAITAAESIADHILTSTLGVSMT